MSTDLESPNDTIVRLVDKGLEPGFATALAHGADACAQSLRSWENELIEEDWRELVYAFYRAESLARAALVTAIEQVHESHRSGLQEQLEDESRHVDVFAGWIGDAPELGYPKPKTREDGVWFAVLLINVITGYCQFRMLSALLSSPEQRAEIEQVIGDEENHIVRLVRWLEPIWPTPNGHIPRQMITAFVRGLNGRMCQFFPRNDLDGLRQEIGGHIGTTLRALPTEQG